MQDYPPRTGVSVDETGRPESDTARRRAGTPEFSEHSLRSVSRLAKVVKNDQIARQQASKMAKPLLREDSMSPIL